MPSTYNPVPLRNAAQTALAAVSGMPAIKLRNRPVFLAGDPEQILVISWGQDSMTPAEDMTFEDQSTFGYSLVFTLLDQEDYQTGSEPDNVITWRTQTRQTLCTVLAGITELYDWKLTLGKMLEPKTAGDVGYFESSLSITWRINEGING